MTVDLSHTKGVEKVTNFSPQVGQSPEKFASNDTYVSDLLLSYFCIIILCFWFDYIYKCNRRYYSRK